MLREAYSTSLHCVQAQEGMSVSPDVIAKIEEGYAKLQVCCPNTPTYTKVPLQAAPECHSLLKKYLTKEVVDELKDKKTKLGATLLDVIQSGVANLDSGVGVYAPDAEAYTLFKPLFDPLIQVCLTGHAWLIRDQARAQSICWTISAFSRSSLFLEC